MFKLILLAALATAPYRELRHLYDYDAKTPLDAREAGVTDREGIQVHDVSFASPSGGRVTAYLLVPAGTGPFPAVLFMHGAGGVRAGRSMDSGMPFARAGIASLSIDGPYSGARAAPGEQIWDPDKPAARNRDALIQTVIDLRRSVDFLLSRPEVDGKRLGFSGGSYGALTGGVLAGVETRIKAYALMSGLPSILEAQIPRIQGVAKQDGAAELFDPVAPIHYIGHAAPASTDRLEWMKKQLGVTPLNQAILDGLKTNNVR
jgi:cephalosporin-C deacetylase-like acetyl esterase